VNHFNLVIAPLTPFLSHTISKNLQSFGISYYNKKSVLLENFPSVRQSLVNEQGERRFKLFQQLAEIIRSMRSQNGLGSVKQPIKLVRVYLDNPEDLETIRDYFSSDEINVLNVSILNQIKPEYYITLDPCHGKVYRGDYPKIKAAVSKLSINDIKNTEYLDIEGYRISTKQLTINKKSGIEISSNESMLEKDGICVVLDKTQDEEVKIHHFIRVIIFNTQCIRKNAGIRPWNKISFMYSTSNSTLYNWLKLNKTELENSLGYPVTDVFKKEAPNWSDDLIEYEEDIIRLVIYKLD
jgi:valyl-tRNA synthetase